MTTPDTSDRMELYESVLSRGGAMLNTGEHLGVMVAPAESFGGCPPGWAFVPIESITFELFNECLDAAKLGRASWPPRDETSPDREPTTWDKVYLEIEASSLFRRSKLRWKSVDHNHLLARCRNVMQRVRRRRGQRK